MEEKEREQNLSKEEILARSRRENAKGDEREQEKWKWTAYSGYLAAIFTVFIITMIYIFLHVSEAHFYALFVFLGTTMSAQTTCQAIVMRKGKGKTISIVCAVMIIIGTVIMWGLFGSSLAGIL